MLTIFGKNIVHIIILKQIENIHSISLEEIIKIKDSVKATGLMLQKLKDNNV
jgi:hypothetical protein